MILRRKIQTGLLLSLLSVLSISMRPGHAAPSVTAHAGASPHGAYFSSNDFLDFIAAGEQKEGFVPLKTPAKPAFKTRLNPWCGNPIRYRNGDSSACCYFLNFWTTIVTLEPPDIIFPFHSFW